jgi:hypothetical protein
MQEIAFARRRGWSAVLGLQCISASRYHHLLKTFWGWHDKHLSDATVIWTTPSGQSYVTTPGSALLFPTLCAPTGDVPTPDLADLERCGERTAMMPLRTTTRAQNRVHRIAAERRHNRQARQPASPRQPAYSGPAPPGDSDDEPPPF